MFSEAPPTTITSSVKLLPQQSHIQQFTNKCWNQFTSEDEASEHQEELKSAKTEFIKEDREKMRDPEPCRINHTEDTEQQTGWCLFFFLH